LSPITLTNTSSPITFQVAGEGDLDDSNNSVEVQLSAALTSATVQLELLTDNYGEETSWNIQDENGAVVAQGSGYQSVTLYTEDITLPSLGCFTFNIADSYGDGICCAYGTGYYILKDEDGNEIISGGEFAEAYTEIFENDLVSGIAEISDLNALSIYPNPVENNVNVAFDLAKSIDTQVEIFNLLGERVFSQDMGVLAAGSQLITIDLSTVDNGVYFLAITSEGKVNTKKITVSK